MDPDEVIEKIETVDIQGATSVARAGIELLQSMEEEGRSEEEIAAVEARLRDARPTEPLLFNALDAADAMGYDAVLDHIEEAQATIADRAAGLVHDGDVIYTHCHSSTVTSALRTAAEDTGFSVHVTETRPLYQGRETARELADAGIPVELYVDAGARLALEEADRMMIGADAVTVEGTVINKIGSGLVAEAAADRGVPVTVLTDAWKVDPRSRSGYSERLEERAAAEVWEDRPDGVDVVNYAFERVAPGAVDSIVSELGRHEPNAFMDAAHEAYPEVL